MDKITNINYTIINQNNEQGSSRLEININGEQINYIILNTIRRAILTYIPIYAFSNFIFSLNESIYNNNYIKLRIKNLPIWGIENKIDTLEKKNIKADIILDDENNINDDDNLDMSNSNIDTINISSLNQLNMYVEYTNNTNTIYTVSTDDVKFYYGEKSIPSPYTIPIPIIKLHPNKRINFTAITTVGNEKENSIYSAVCACFYKEIDDHNYNLIVESRGQLTEKRIIEVALINLINTIENIAHIIPDKTDNIDTNKGELIFIGENSTIGNLLSHGLQNHKKIKFAGYNSPHPLEEKVIIHYELFEKTDNIKKICNDVIINYIELFNILLSLNNSI